MKFITVSELRARASEIVSEIEATKEPVVVTKNGKPVVLMQFVTDEAFGLKSLTDAELDERIKALLKADEPRGEGSKGHLKDVSDVDLASRIKAARERTKGVK